MVQQKKTHSSYFGLKKNYTLQNRTILNCSVFSFNPSAKNEARFSIMLPCRTRQVGYNIREKAVLNMSKFETKTYQREQTQFNLQEVYEFYRKIFVMKNSKYVQHEKNRKSLYIAYNAENYTDSELYII